jgi:ketosteroid isomerase-like protein
MDSELYEPVTRLFAAIEARNIDAALACFAPDALIVDPHYPTPTMRGHAPLAEGLSWAFGLMEQMRFTPRHVCVAADKRVVMIEVATHHTVRGGQQLRFDQVFVIEIDNGLITRFQAYTPHGPPGIGGALLGFERLRRRIGFLRRRFTTRSRDQR